MLEQGVKNPIGFSATGGAGDQPGLLHHSGLEERFPHEINRRNGNHSHYGRSNVTSACTKCSDPQGSTKQLLKPACLLLAEN